LPYWLNDVIGLDGKPITFRTDDETWLQLMFTFFDKTIDLLDEKGLFANKGGPIVMIQIENEYGDFENDFGDAGIR